MKRPRLDLNDAVQHPGRHVTFDVSTSLEDEEDLDLLEPVQGALDAVSTGNVLLIKGVFRTVAVLECSRCLAPVSVPVEFTVNEEFSVKGTPAAHGNREHAEVEEDEPYPLFEGNSLLYEDLIRQSLWLSLPVKPLCGEDCEGMPDANSEEEPGRPELKILSRLLEDESA